MKRCFDVVAAAICLILSLPLFAVIAIVIRVTSSGPVFFRQTRIGRGRRSFQLLKFRSMVQNATELGAFQTVPGDPRITRTGRFLRSTSLDELPQLINVIRGDMSLVGPRPDVPEQMNLYTEEESIRRHSVRPGITGLAQARCRNSGTIQLRKELDLEYVRTASLLLDFKILILTVRQVIGKGSF